MIVQQSHMTVVDIAGTLMNVSLRDKQVCYGFHKLAIYKTGIKLLSILLHD